MNDITKSTVQKSAATAGLGIGPMTYPVVAGGFAAATPVGALIAITAGIGLGIAMASAAALVGYAMFRHTYTETQKIQARIFLK